MSRVILAADMKGYGGYLLPELSSCLAIAAAIIHNIIGSCLLSLVDILRSQLHAAGTFVGI
jgi:hypothetical protein